MNKLIRMTVIALVSLWGISSANAIPVLSFDASNADITKNYQVGDTIVMELWISGLTDIDLAGFDLGLSFTPAVSSYQSTDFAPELSDQDFILLDDWLVNPGELNLSGVSLAPDLSAQADVLRIATLSFTALSAGSSWLSFDYSLLSDEFAEAFASTNFGATINVSNRPVTVPEPSALLLLILGISGLLVRAKLVR